jgi:hypothetical protein
MTAQIATTRPPEVLSPRAHAVTMANLVTEAAVVIGETTVVPRSIMVRLGIPGYSLPTVEVQVATADDVDEVGRVFALPVIEWSEHLHTRAWDGVSLAGDLVTVRVYSGAQR